MRSPAELRLLTGLSPAPNVGRGGLAAVGTHERMSVWGVHTCHGDVLNLCSPLLPLSC